MFSKGKSVQKFQKDKDAKLKEILTSNQEKCGEKKNKIISNVTQI